jgi:uncharacterized oxidoreductase
MNLSNNKILITGGASGIGLGLTERFLEENNTVIICGRRESVLNEVKEKYPTVITKVCDLTNKEDRDNLYNWISKEHNDLNVLINNAGIQQWMKVTDADFFERAEKEVETNVMAPIHLSHLFLNLPSLNTIINVSSALAFIQLAKVPVYCGTKAFLHSYSESLRYLLNDRNIEVIEMIPPAINTDLGGIGLHDHAPPVSAFIDSIFEQLKEQKSKLTFGYSEVVANANPEALKLAFKQMNP